MPSLSILFKSRKKKKIMLLSSKSLSKELVPIFKSILLKKKTFKGSKKLIVKFT